MHFSLDRSTIDRYKGINKNGVRQMTNREALIKNVWRNTHKDYKGTYNGIRTIMVLRNGTPTLVALSDLTDEEIASRIR